MQRIINFFFACMTIVFPLSAPVAHAHVTYRVGMHDSHTSRKHIHTSTRAHHRSDPAPKHELAFDSELSRAKESASSTGLAPHGVNYDALQFFYNSASSVHSTTIPWTPVAPLNFSGRITAIALATGHPDTILAGAADGGVWRTLNGGSTFSPVFDTMPSLSIGALEWDPTSPTIVYAGTGESNGNGDAYPGMGLYASLDAGATWQYAGLGGLPFISAIAINPDNSNELFVAGMGGLDAADTIGGVFHSTNRGASWTKISHPAIPPV